MCRNITELRGLEPPATSEEIAAAALWLCEAEARFITGQAIAVAGGEVM